MFELSSHRWDPESNRWSFVCPMSVARLGAGVTACGGFLYVVGGYDGQTRWNTAERYQPDTNAWQPLAPMSVTRSGLGEFRTRAEPEGISASWGLAERKRGCV